MNTEWIAVDWGTSNLRAWGIAANNQQTFAASSPLGMGKLTPDAFPRVLEEVVGKELPADSPPVDVLICGMAGARQGWMEAPYLDVPADLTGLAFASVQPAIPDARLKPRILPGVCQKLAGAEDVMRGEETQILGLSAMIPGFAGVAIHPGTHSKWIAVNGRRIERFATAMTGEIFEVMRTHSVLRLTVSANAAGEERDAGFAAGLPTGIDAPEKLTSLLFKVRTGALLSGRHPDWCAGFLSGLLIGAEIGGHRDWLASESDEIPLVGSSTLCGLYAQGLARIGVRTRIVDATEATLAGLKAARRNLR